ALGIFFMLLLVQDLGVKGALVSRERLENEWAATRQALMSHREARKAKKDLSRVWAVLPAERDFTPLALGISDEAKRDRVTLPALSYKTEPTLVANTSKGLLHGPMTGRYEDLRRFIYGLETAEELVLIEDLELTRSGGAQDALLTFNIRIATYLRADAEAFNRSGPAQ
ncbi:MAG: type 4a pilus biogenesis protein PilO, partial [Nitrospira sp.]